VVDSKEVLGGAVGAVGGVEASNTARGTAHAHYCPTVVVTSLSLAASAGLVEHSVVSCRTGETLPCVIAEQTVIGTGCTGARTIAHILPHWTLALTELLKKSEAEYAGRTVIQRYAGRTPSRAKQDKPGGGVLKISDHSDASSSRGKGSVVRAGAAQALILGIAGETVVGAGDAGES
jgi:hypothetical protein